MPETPRLVNVTPTTKTPTMLDELKAKAEEATARITQKVEEEGGWKDTMGDLQNKVSAAVGEKVDTLMEESEGLAADLKVEAEKRKIQASAVLADVIDSLPDGVKETIQKIIEEAEEQMRKAEAFVEEKKQAFLKYKEEIEAKIRAEIEKMILERVAKAFELAGDEMKAGLKEDEMPDAVQGAVDAAVDIILFEVELEVQQFVKEQCRETEPGHDEGVPIGWNTPLSKLRAVILYTMFPWDKSIWVQIRNPIWWLITLVALGPIYGCSQFVFLMFFALKDKSEEYQLCEFIFAFKTACFISHGLISMFVGAALYVLCTNKEDNTCAANGPAQYPLFQLDMLFWVLQIFLLWAAGILLPYSKAKGKEHVKLTEAEKKEFEEHVKDEDCFGNEKNNLIGRRVRKLLIYDLLVFIICAGVVGYSAFVEWDHHDPDSEHRWKTFALMYWMRTLYGFLSFPFFVIGLPGLFLMFTHAKPTAYNENGECVPLITGAQKKARKEQELKSGTFGVNQSTVGIETNPTRVVVES